LACEAEHHGEREQVRQKFSKLGSHGIPHENFKRKQWNEHSRNKEYASDSIFRYVRECRSILLNVRTILVTDVERSNRFGRQRPISVTIGRGSRHPSRQ
jgi:hypothetical protein